MNRFVSPLIILYFLANTALACSSYNPDNPFHKIIKGELKPSKIYESSYSLAFKDIKMRVKSHSILIPKGHYVSFSNFMDTASDQEIIDLIRSIPQVAKHAGISKTGYRIITNDACHPKSEKNNNAYQEVPHFHIHIAGGECLGLPVAGLKSIPGESLGITKSERYKVNNSIGTDHEPFGSNMTPDDLSAYALKNKIKMTHFKNKKGEARKILTFSIKGKENVPTYFGLVLLDKTNHILYKSLDDLAQNGDQAELVHFFKEARKITLAAKLDKGGYRIYSNSGPDSWNTPERLQLFIAGGTILGPTVTNVYGNRKTGGTGESEKFYYYADLKDQKHDSCPIQ